MTCFPLSYRCFLTDSTSFVISSNVNSDVLVDSKRVLNLVRNNDFFNALNISNLSVSSNSLSILINWLFSNSMLIVPTIQKLKFYQK